MRPDCLFSHSTVTIEGNQRRSIYTHHALNAGSSLGCNVDWTSHPLHQTQRALRITKIKRTCPFQELQVGDIITHINCNQVSSKDAFNRKFTKETTLRVISLGMITLLQKQQHSSKNNKNNNTSKPPPPPPQQQQPRFDVW